MSPEELEAELREERMHEAREIEWEMNRVRCKICDDPDVEMKGMCHACLKETYIGGNYE